MTEYEVIYMVRISAEDKSDLYEKSENINKLFTKAVRSKVTAMGYKKSEEINDVQQKLI